MAMTGNYEDGRMDSILCLYGLNPAIDKDGCTKNIDTHNKELYFDLAKKV